MTIQIAESSVVDVLDVGHGSCVAIRSGSEVLLIDTGPGGAVLEYLREEGITHIDTILISHADADHIGGLSAILAQRELSVGRIVWNGDAAKQSRLWKNLVYQLHDLESQGLAVAHQNAFDGLVLDLGDGSDVSVHIFAPGLILRQLGAGSSTRDNRSITSNSVSVVAQVVVAEESILLVMGDLDRLGFDLLTESLYGGRLQSKYLVLPHHGGLMGSSRETAEAVTALVATVRPEGVFISNGRNRFGNPREDVVRAIRAADSSVHISCTQLSARCSRDDIQQPASRSPYSYGWRNGFSCQGSTRLRQGDGISAPLDRTRHLLFISQSVPSPICGQRALSRLAITV